MWPIGCAALSRGLSCIHRAYGELGSTAVGWEFDDLQTWELCWSVSGGDFIHNNTFWESRLYVKCSCAVGWACGWQIPSVTRLMVLQVSIRVILLTRMSVGTTCSWLSRIWQILQCYCRVLFSARTAWGATSWIVLNEHWPATGARLASRRSPTVANTSSFRCPSNIIQSWKLMDFWSRRIIISWFGWAGSTCCLANWVDVFFNCHCLHRVWSSSPPVAQ